MPILITVLGLALASVLFAYVPIALIVRHTLNTELPKPKDVLHMYVVDDDISTEDYIAWVEEQWQEVKHVPLKIDA